jgi:hypothetical protein
VAASENTKIQVNYKLNDGTMVNVYATDQADLEASLTVVQDLTALIATTGQALAGVGAIPAQTINVNERVAELRAAAPTATAPANPSAPTCKHGAMTYRTGISQKTGKEWKAWMCPAPKGTPDQCPADFIR